MPIQGGCRNQSCKFIHPGDRGFERAEDAKRTLRCKYFDHEGRSIHPGCFHTSDTCPYVHPDTPEWSSSKAEPSRSARSARVLVSPPAVIARPSTPGQAPPTDVVLQPLRPSSSLAGTFRAPSVDKSRSHQTTIANIPGRSASSETEQMSDVTTPSGPNNVTDRSQIVYSSTQLIKPIRATSSMPAVPQNAENATSRMWKKWINCLSRATEISNQLLEMENSIVVRKNLISLTVGPNHTSSVEKDLEAYEVSAKEKRKALELELEKVEGLLTGLGFWSVPLNLNPPESSDRRLDLNQLLERLRVLEARLSTFIDSRQGMDRALASLERRAALNDVEEFTAEDVSERLNHLQTRVNQLETEVPYDRMLERLNDLVEDRMLDRLGPSEHAIPTATPKEETPNAIVKRIDEDLTQLWTDLLDNAPLDVLETNLQRLYSETESVRGNVSHLLDGQRSLDSRQRDVDVQMERLLQELDEMKVMTGQNRTQEDASAIVLDEIMSNVQRRVDNEQLEVQEYVKQIFGRLESKTLVDLEPTISQTRTIYKSLVLPGVAGSFIRILLIGVALQKHRGAFLDGDLATDPQPRPPRHIHPPRWMILHEEEIQAGLESVLCRRRSPPLDDQTTKEVPHKNLAGLLWKDQVQSAVLTWDRPTSAWSESDGGVGGGGESSSANAWGPSLATTVLPPHLPPPAKSEQLPPPKPLATHTATSAIVSDPASVDDVAASARPAPSKSEIRSQYAKRVMYLTDVITLRSEYLEILNTREARRKMRTSESYSHIGEKARETLEKVIREKEEKAKDVKQRLDALIAKLADSEAWPIVVKDPIASTEHLTPEKYSDIISRLHKLEDKLANVELLTREAHAIEMQPPQKAVESIEHDGDAMERLELLDTRVSDLENEQTQQNRNFEETIDGLLNEKLGNVHLEAAANGDIEMANSDAITKPTTIGAKLGILIREYEGLDNEVANLITKHAEICVQARVLEGENTKLKQEVLASQQAMEQLQLRVDRSEQQIQAMSDTIKTLREQITRPQAPVVDARALEPLQTRLQNEVLTGVNVSLLDFRNQLEKSMTATRQDTLNNIADKFGPTMQFINVIYEHFNEAKAS
ncbi:hypothetical protein BU17DRAFT_91645 [Hysterangium stoloniferum]|nr:hypothetical protein BU17DRAFT_91645 [Hysterangium stoloniferum]